MTTTEVIGATVGGTSVVFTVGQIVLANIRARVNGRYVQSALCDSKMDGIGRSLDSLKAESSEMRQDIRNILSIIRNGGQKQ
jgi:hypothetical protein